MRVIRDRHRQFQIGLTVGVIISSTMDLLGMPHATATGALVSLIWIWEK